MADALAGLLGHDALAEALHPLLIHQVLQSLSEGGRKGEKEDRGTKRVGGREKEQGERVRVSLLTATYILTLHPA